MDSQKTMNPEHLCFFNSNLYIAITSTENSRKSAFWVFLPQKYLDT